jgi:hypothetical protein
MLLQRVGDLAPDTSIATDLGVIPQFGGFRGRTDRTDPLWPASRNAVHGRKDDG